MKDKEMVLLSKGFDVKFNEHWRCVYISTPIYGEETSLPETFEILDYEEWLDEDELREVKANALECAIYGNISFKEAYEEGLLNRCWEKMQEEINERIDAWENVPKVERKINGETVEMYTSWNESDGYITYSVTLEMSIELYEKLSVEQIMDLFEEMIEQLNYPDLGLPEFI